MKSREGLNSDISSMVGELPPLQLKITTGVIPTGFIHNSAKPTRSVHASNQSPGMDYNFYMIKGAWNLIP